MPESKTSVRRLQAVERAKQALELRKGGASFPEIGRVLGYSGPAGAYQAVMSALRKTLKEPADEVRTLETARLDAMLLALWPQVKQGNQGAIDRALRIAERRARLLGLDGEISRKVELTGREGGPVEVYDHIAILRKLVPELAAAGEEAAAPEADRGGDSQTEV